MRAAWLPRYSALAFWNRVQKLEENELYRTGLARFERATCRLGGGRSIQLSYSPKSDFEGFANAQIPHGYPITSLYYV